MSSRACLALLFTLTMICGSMAAITQDDRDVQTLASFPALQKLSRDSAALRGFLNGVADTYQGVGYAGFARELRRSGALVGLFGQPERANGSSLRQARTALRRLTAAFGRSDVALPAEVGDTRPDYHGIATLFLDGAEIALKNLSLHKNVANTLRDNKGTLWLTNRGGNTFTLSGSLAKHGSVTFTLNGQLAIAHGTVSQLGTQTYSAAINNVTVTNLSGGSLTGTNYRLSDGGSLNLTLQIVSGNQKSVAFPPGVDLPLGQDYTITETLSVARTINDVELPAGTQIIRIAEDFTLPSGSIAVPTNVNAPDGPNKYAFGTGNVTLTSGPYYHSSTLGNYRLVGAIAHIDLATAEVWLAFLPGTTIPTDLIPKSLLLGQAYTTGSTSLPAGTRIAVITDISAVPDGAIALPGADFTLTPAP